uniref:Para-hydroxybenzoate--polyprenyltransferase n=1 Tax=Piliocolobus tephrosceles TaxID=591936 RepID=A0A8C9H5Q6_9PRIM
MTFQNVPFNLFIIKNRKQDLVHLLNNRKNVNRKKLFHLLEKKNNTNIRSVMPMMTTKCNYTLKSNKTSVEQLQLLQQKRHHSYETQKTDLFKKNLQAYILLSRLHIPTPIYLLFYSAIYGYFLTYNVDVLLMPSDTSPNAITNIINNIIQYNLNWEEVNTIVKNICFMYFGSINIRIVGCIINDFFDRNFDKHVERTKNRPLADGSISIKRAGIYFCIHSCLALLTLLQFNNNTIQTGLFSTLFILTYPLFKRITHYAQVYLSLTFNLGFFIASSINIDLTQHILPLAISFLPLCFLTIIYDTIYAYPDKKDDLKLKLKSLAIKWDKNILKYSKILTINMLYLFYLSAYLFDMHYSYYILSPLSVFYLYNMINQTDLNNKKAYMNFFKKSKNVICMIALAALMAKICEALQKGQRSSQVT